MQTETEHRTRQSYKRRVAGLLSVCLWVLALMLLRSKAASYFFSYKLVPAIPLMLVLLGLLAIKISNWLAIQKFGVIEKNEQAVEAQKRQAKLESLVASEAYKQRAYARKLFVCLMFIFIVVFYPLAGLAEQYFRISGWITFNVALIAAVSLAYFIAHKQANRKFGNK
jgi:hypothetical protein